MAVACTIAGSDSGGGAGIQADLKTFAAHGVFGTSVVVAITAQNTVGVRGVMEATPAIVAAQIDAVAEDLRPAAWKTGMLASFPVIEVVAAGLRAHTARNLVVDPVMVAKSGDRLLAADAVEALTRLLLPLALVVTPNLPEAEALTGLDLSEVAVAREAARRIAALGPRYVVVKGGHWNTDPVVDLVYHADRADFEEIVMARVGGTSTHGTGCTFSAAITAHLAGGAEPGEAIARARAYLQDTLLWAPGLGSGHGPLGHFRPR